MKVQHIALVGNPNSGKSTLFNQLTGLRQKTGNFPGVTVDKKSGTFKLPNQQEVILTDLPGTYSLYPTSSDEKIVASILTNPKDPNYPDLILYTADANNIEKHLLLLTQLLDLGIPIICVLNMADIANQAGIKVDTQKLSDFIGIPIIYVSARTGENVTKIGIEIESMFRLRSMSNNQTIPTINSKIDRNTATLVKPRLPFYIFTETEKQIAEAVKHNFGIENPYNALLLAHHKDWLPQLTETERNTLTTITETKKFQSLRSQVDETLDRFDKFVPKVHEAVQLPRVFPITTTDKIDAILTHRWWGPVVFFAVMALIFQAIYDWSKVPMDFIEGQFNGLSSWLKTVLPEHWATDLLTDGILAGLGGILVFIPQITILFFLVTILEEVGYMSRVVFMFDKTIRRFGMNGRSVVALISSSACAVPAIMSARTIGNWQERIITIMTTPFISCSARIPVYAVLIGLTVPNTMVGGFINLQSLVFGSMYFLGVFAAFVAGYIFKKVLKTREPSFLAIELPIYKLPHWKNVWLTLLEKVGAFVLGAGKIIIIISVILWALARFGPAEAMKNAETMAQTKAISAQLDTTQTADLVAAAKLEASWAGYLGKSIEPAIRPLGYDWKIGIALITSFAAREVFVGTMSTIYSIGSASGDETLLREKMRTATFADSGKPVYTLATTLSLLVFYALAMQCMSTLAVVKRETGSWKWSLLQFLFMSLVAYFGAWAVYWLFS
jgi:ferrous iron transport protein B